jgi:hypothetical protein
LGEGVRGEGRREGGRERGRERQKEFLITIKK